MLFPLFLDYDKCVRKLLLFFGVFIVLILVSFSLFVIPSNTYAFKPSVGGCPDLPPIPIDTVEGAMTPQSQLTLKIQWSKMTADEIEKYKNYTVYASVYSEDKNTFVTYFNTSDSTPQERKSDKTLDLTLSNIPTGYYTFYIQLEPVPVGESAKGICRGYEKNFTAFVVKNSSTITPSPGTSQGLLLGQKCEMGESNPKLQCPPEAPCKPTSTFNLYRCGGEVTAEQQSRCDKSINISSLPLCDPDYTLEHSLRCGKDNIGFVCERSYAKPCMNVNRSEKNVVCGWIDPLKPPCTEGVDENNNPTSDPKKIKKCLSIMTGLGIPIQTTPIGMIQNLFSILLSLSGGIAVLLIISGGYQIIMSQGNPEKIQAAKETITSAIIGLLFILFSMVILQVIGFDILKIPSFNQANNPLPPAWPSKTPTMTPAPAVPMSVSCDSLNSTGGPNEYQCSSAWGMTTCPTSGNWQAIAGYYCGIKSAVCCWRSFATPTPTLTITPTPVSANCESLNSPANANEYRCSTSWAGGTTCPTGWSPLNRISCNGTGVCCIQKKPTPTLTRTPTPVR